MRPTWGGSERRGGGSPFSISWYAIPVTRFLLFSMVALFFAYYMLDQQRSPIWSWLPFVARGSGDLTWAWQAWRWVTYTLLEFDVWILISLYILYSIGGMLERSWGSVNFAVLYAAFSAIGAVALGAGSVLLNHPILLLGPSITLTALVTAWAALDPELDVTFFGAPLKAKVIAYIWIGLMVYRFLMMGGIFLAVFALAAPAAAFFYVRKMPRLNLSLGGRRDSWRPGLREEPRDRWAPDLREDRDDRPTHEPRSPEDRERVGGFNPLRKRQEQIEIERLRKLLGEDDDGKPAGRR